MYKTEKKIETASKEENMGCFGGEGKDYSVTSSCQYALQEKTHHMTPTSALVF